MRGGLHFLAQNLVIKYFLDYKNDIMYNIDIERKEKTWVLQQVFVSICGIEVFNIWLEALMTCLKRINLVGTPIPMIPQTNPREGRKCGKRLCILLWIKMEGFVELEVFVDVMAKKKGLCGQHLRWLFLRTELSVKQAM